MSKLLNRLLHRFGDEEYAHAYMEGHLITRIAAQIHALRRDRGWTQQELAEKAGVAQERVSKIESGDFESLTMKTLLKFARAFDINLEIAYSTFSHGMLDVANLSADKLVVPARAEDLKRFAAMNITTSGTGQVVAFARVSDPGEVIPFSRSTVGKIVPKPVWSDFARAEVHAERRTN